MHQIWTLLGAPSAGMAKKTWQSVLDSERAMKLHKTADGQVVFDGRDFAALMPRSTKRTKVSNSSMAAP